MDDHALVRRGIRGLLDQQSTWTVCGEADNGEEAIKQVLALKPDLVLMDISMPIMNGIEATKKIRSQSPGTRIIILSMHDSVHVEQQVKEAGANAFLNKSSSTESLQAMIHEILKRPA